MEPHKHPLTTGLLLVATVLSLLTIGTSSMSCLAPVPHSSLIGGACTAEALSQPMTWISREQIVVLPTEKILLVVAAFVMIFACTQQHTSARRRSLCWFNTRQNFSREGPIPDHLFLPYLFATHGW